MTDPARDFDSLFTLLTTGFPPAASIIESRRNLAALYARFPPDADVSFEDAVADGVPVCWVRAPDTPDPSVILFLHGGGWTAGSTRDHGDLLGRLSRASKMAVLGVDYRLAPEHPFPAAVDDVLTAYRWLIGRVPAKSVVIAGCSSGGGMALSALLASKQRGLPQPAGAIAMSPLVDLLFEGASFTTNVGRDWVRPERLRATVATWLAGTDPSEPLASPIHGDLQGLAPVLLQVGGRELLRDDARRFAQRARAAGTAVTLQEWPDMIHVWQIFASTLTAGRDAIANAADFAREHSGP
jgi:acetyl esterase/lipase